MICSTHLSNPGRGIGASLPSQCWQIHQGVRWQGCCHTHEPVYSQQNQAAENAVGKNKWKESPARACVSENSLCKHHNYQRIGKKSQIFLLQSEESEERFFFKHFHNAWRVCLYLRDHLELPHCGLCWKRDQELPGSCQRSFAALPCVSWRPADIVKSKWSHLCAGSGPQIFHSSTHPKLFCVTKNNGASTNSLESAGFSAWLSLVGSSNAKDAWKTKQPIIASLHQKEQGAAESGWQAAT